MKASLCQHPALTLGGVLLWHIPLPGKYKEGPHGYFEVCLYLTDTNRSLVRSAVRCSDSWYTRTRASHRLQSLSNREILSWRTPCFSWTSVNKSTYYICLVRVYSLFMAKYAQCELFGKLNIQESVCKAQLKCSKESNLIKWPSHRARKMHV